MLKYKIEIEIDKIEIDDKYFSFKWKAKIVNKKQSGNYESDYESRTPKEMKKILEKGYALDLVLEQLTD